MKILKYFKIRRIVKKVNQALNIKLHKWQIDFIFDGKPYSEEIRKERCNGKTLAHILRICLKASNADIHSLQREGCNYSKDLYLYIPRLEMRKLIPFAGDDKEPYRRLDCFYYFLRDTYEKLVHAKIMKDELRDIRFSTYREGVRLI